MTGRQFHRMSGLWIVATAVSVAAGGTPLGSEFTYQGRLQFADSAYDGSADLRFTLWNAAVGGGTVGSAGASPGVLVDKGLFTVPLDFGVTVFDGNSRWLEIEVRTPAWDGMGAEPAYTTLSPRQPLTATPYALQTRGLFVDDAGNVGINTTSPQQDLDVAGDIRGQRVAIGNDASFGPGSNYDYMFDFSQTIADLSGSESWAPFRSHITLLPDADYIGANPRYYYGHDLYSNIPSSNDKDLEYFSGPYLYAHARGSGDFSLINGALVGGQHAGTGHVDYLLGLYAVSQVGFIAGTTGTAGWNAGIEIHSGHEGTGGSIDLNFGLHVDTPPHLQPLNNHYGIYLEDQDFGVNDSFALYSAGGDSFFNGDMEVTGLFQAGTGMVTIDHPVDPQTKVLNHALVASPEMTTVTSGNVVLDDIGQAVVELPDWFEALNGDFRYQLTTIGGYAPVYVAEKIRDHRFHIAGGTPGLEVSWQVTAVRQDAYARAHPLTVEQFKPAREQGYFRQPEAFGASASKSIQTPRDAGRLRPPPSQQLIRPDREVQPGPPQAGAMSRAQDR